MNKIVFPVLASAFFLACDNKASNHKDIDSLEKRTENSIEEMKDTAKTTIDRWEDSLEKDRTDSSGR